MKRMKNLTTGLIWEVSGELLERLLADPNYEVIIEGVTQEEKPKRNRKSR